MALRLLENLNPSQAEAVSHGSGPLLVLAGAGSGKTRIITHRISHLIQNLGVKPYYILAVTFTNKAAAEMTERVHSLIGSLSAGLWAGTFHSICLRILKRESESLGAYNKNFVIFDGGDQERVIKACLKQLDLSEKIFEPSSVRGKIDRTKNDGLGPEALNSNLFDKRIAQIMELYNSELIRLNAMDFTDLILNTVRLFENNSDVLERYQRTFEHILVDEFQDTNNLQYRFLKQLSLSGKSLFVVGDDNQSIYGWRGAQISNILNFDKDYPDAKVVKLEQNYRSTKTILDAANALINKNTLKHEKKLWTENNTGEKITYAWSADDRGEAGFVVSTILKEVENGRSLGDFAIFYRTNSLSRLLEEELVKQRVPYVVVGSVGFYSRAEIRDVIAYLRLVANPDDDMSLKRIINVPKRGIGKRTVEILEEEARGSSASIYEAIDIALDAQTLSTRVSKKIEQFKLLIEELRRFSEEKTVSGLLGAILDSTGYLSSLEKEPERIDNVGELLNEAVEFEKGQSGAQITDFLNKVSLVSDPNLYNDSQETVSLMTLHSSKGLEFPVVFIVGLEERILPHSRSLKDKRDEEEERRLFYVGLTRAQEKIFLSSAATRRYFGDQVRSAPSRYIDDIPIEFLERKKVDKERNYLRGAAYNKPSNHDPSHLSADSRSVPENGHAQEQYHLNQRVEHPRFGQGIVKGLDGSGKNAKLFIFFPRHGTKKIMASFKGLKGF